MTGNTHIVIGVATTQLIIFGFGMAVNPLYYLVAILGALMPDLDHSKSKISLYFPFIIFSKIITGMGVKHREETHSVFAVIILSIIPLVFYVLNFGIEYIYVSMFFVIGYASHLFADYFANSGICLLCPFVKKRKKFFITLNTGGIVEKMLAIFISLCIIAHLIAVFIYE